STALAALKLKRRAVSIEIDPAWARKIAARVEEFCAMEDILQAETRAHEPLSRMSKCRSAQMTLFTVSK
ncbi:MAG TPA: hypothetical protein PLZ55_02860, partial [bacterium]|nr:hypothetical protein [bacterium]